MIDKIINYTIGLGFPKLIFLILKWTSEHEGAAALTSRLKDISLRIGMEEGVGVFVLLGILSYQISSHYVEKFYHSKIERQRIENKLNTTDVLTQLNFYQISNTLRTRLKAKYILENS